MNIFEFEVDGTYFFLVLNNKSEKENMQFMNV